MKLLQYLLIFACFLQTGSVFGAYYGDLTIDLTFSGPQISVSQNGGVSFGNIIGDYDGLVTSADPPAFISQSFKDLVGSSVELYCVELTQGVPNASGVVFNIVDLEDLAQISGLEATRVRQLVTAQGGAIPSAEAAKAEGQAAVWEIIHDDGALDLSSGDYQVDGFSGGGTVAGAQALLNSVLAGGLAEATVFGLYNPTTQDYGVLVVGGGEEIPEPAAIVNLIGLVAIGGVLGFRRRCRKK